MTPFAPKKIIVNPDELFGRRDLLDQLVTLANNGYCVSLIGLRRFGKTSVIKCVETLLRSNTNSRAYPVFFDFKEVGSVIKGTDNVYRYMISRLMARLYEDNLFYEDYKIKKVVITASHDWEDIYENLMEINAVRIQSVFEEVVFFISEHLGKTILFLIDEYEWLFRFSFAEPVGFMKLRNFCSKPSDLDHTVFSFWISGTTSWDYLCTITGSGELNVIDAPPVFIGQIDCPSFISMWDFETSKVKPQNDYIKNYSELAFNLSGGIPFYGKLIGSQLLSAGTTPDFTHFQPHFNELFESLQVEEKAVLLQLSDTPKKFVNNKYLIGLKEKGLFKNQEGILQITRQIFKEFIFSNSFQGIAVPSILPDSYKLTDNITSLIMNINKTHSNKKGTYIFEPINDDAALTKDLRTPCYSQELFSDFASSIYKIVFEKTKGIIKGKEMVLQRLPTPYKRGHKFIDIIDIMRHSLGGGHLMETFKHRKGQLTKVKMLELLNGSKNEPNSPEDFYSLQIAVLKLFEQELTNINTMIRALK